MIDYKAVFNHISFSDGTRSNLHNERALFGTFEFLSNKVLTCSMWWLCGQLMSL